MKSINACLLTVEVLRRQIELESEHLDLSTYILYYSVLTLQIISNIPSCQNKRHLYLHILHAEMPSRLWIPRRLS